MHKQTPDKNSASVFTSVNDVIRHTRSRWRLKTGLAGTVVVLAAGLFLVLLASLLLNYLRFDPGVITVVSVVMYLLLLAFAAHWLLTPLTQPLPDQQVALYLEEHEPDLDGAVVTALDAGAANGNNSRGGLLDGLHERALHVLKQVEFGKRIERSELRRAGTLIAAIVIAVAAIVALAPPVLTHGMWLALLPWGGASVAGDNPYAVFASPGDTTILHGDDQRIVANLEGFESSDVTLFFKQDDDTTWQQKPMSGGAQAAAHELFLFDIENPIEYYVQADRLRTPSYRIDVTDPPALEKLTLQYHYPEHTGLDTRTVEDDGDITAPKDTEVRVTIRANEETHGGEIVMEDGETIAFQRDDDGTLSARLTVAKDASYRVALQAQNGTFIDASPEYAIDLLENQAPIVKVENPGRDTKVTSVEEPYIEITATDDYGIETVELVLSVNGGEDEIIAIASNPEGDVAKAHTVYLENYGLEPGDLVAYHARAKEPGSGDASLETTTDMYFMEVRPFRLDYRRADSGGGGGGGGQQEQQGNLSAQQRQFVVATFKLVRDKARMPKSRFEDNAATLATAEQRILVRAQAIVRRLQGRRMLGEDSAYQRMSEELPPAIEAMHEAKAHMDALEPEKALPPARKALQHLQRADAAFRELQVTMRQSGGGEGQNQDAEDLANLFRLELDKLRNQYEDVARARPKSAKEELDETLKQLEELAKRQLKQNEQARRRAQMSGSGGGSPNNSQQALAEEVEKLARQLERLTREKDESEALEQTREQLRNAAEKMREAAASGSESDARQARRDALESLREAQQALNRNTTETIKREIEDAARQANELADKQEEIKRTAAEATANGEAQTEQLAELFSEKVELRDELRSLQRELDRLAKATREEQEDASKALESAARDVDRKALEDKIRDSVDALRGGDQQASANIENDIGEGINEIRDQVVNAGNAVSRSEREQLEQALERMRALVRDMESLKERMRTRARMQANRQGQTGEQGEGEEDGDGQNQGENQGDNPGEGESNENGNQQAQANQGRGDQQGQQSGQQPGQQGQQPGEQGGQQSAQGQPGGQPGGTPGSGTTAGQERTAGNGGSGRYDASSRIESTGSGVMDGFREEFADRLADAEQVRQWMPGSAREMGDIEDVIAGLRALGAGEGDADELTRLQGEALERLRAVEYALRRQLEPDEPHAMTLSGRDSTPEAFKEAVEAYYEALSTAKP